MKKQLNLVEGAIFPSLVRFALPVLLALFLQALYGGVDLLIVGQFAKTADVSGVATASMLMHTITFVITGISMGITVLIARHIGKKEPEQAGRIIGSGICLAIVMAVVVTIGVAGLAGPLASLMNAPKEAFAQTSAYLRICGLGAVFIVAYNVLGSVFRGLGDSKTPLLTVAVACCLNIAGDLLLVAVFNMGAAGAAIATVASQGVSVVLSLLIIRRKKLPIVFSRGFIRFDKKLIGEELKLGVPVALQELLVGVSFLIIQVIVNDIGVTASAAVGIAEKVCMFIMLVPSAYIQSMSAFVAQNLGAKQPDRARKALRYGIVSSVSVGVVMGILAFIWGDIMSSLFSHDADVIVNAHAYLKAYAVDCVLVGGLFCFNGFFNGCGKTFFVMLQSLAGAFCVRIPIAYFVSKIQGVTLFEIGLSTPSSTLVQVVLCVIMYCVMRKKKEMERLSGI